MIVLGVSVIAKTTLLGKGYLSLPDEFRYIAAQDCIEFFKKGEFDAALSQLFEVQGRPGLVIAAIFPAGVQIVLSNYLMVPYNSATAAWVIYAYNIVIYLLILWCLFRISKKLGFTIYQSLLTLIIFTFTLNGFIYLRHTFPYDTSLLCGLLAFNLLLGDSPQSFRSLIFQGLAIAACFLIYPGYFPLVFAFAFCWLFQNRASFGSVDWIKQGLVFSAAFSVPFIFIELVAGMCGKSYFFDAKQLSQTIIEGSFEEGFSFLLKYLWQVEQGLGLFYMLGLIIMLYLIFSKFIYKKTALNRAEWLFVTITIGFIFYASLVFFLHKMVFYGRIIHQFIPFMAMFAIYGLFQVIEGEKFRKQLTVALPVFMLILSIPAYSQYSGMEYPRDFFNRSNRNDALKARSIEYSCQWFSSLPRIEKFADTQNIRFEKIILVNWCHPSGDSKQKGKQWNLFFPGPDQKLLARAPHYMSYIGYQFEGANIRQRKELAENPPLLQIYVE